MINNSLVSQLIVHVDTTVVTTWEAAPAQAPVSTMETVVMTTTVSAKLTALAGSSSEMLTQIWSDNIILLQLLSKQLV